MNGGIDLTALERIEVGAECFSEVITVSISNLPNLTEMLFGLFAFHGESFGRADNDISFTSRFVMQDLPKLQVMRMIHNGCHIGTVLAKNVNVDIHRSELHVCFELRIMLVENSPNVEALAKRWAKMA